MNTARFVSTSRLPDFSLWHNPAGRRVPWGFEIEVTARCPNNCRHCYINLPAGDRQARAQELTADEIDRIAGEAAGLGALWCLITGGEPLLRPDFPDIYMRLKRRGLLLSVFTTGTLLTANHVELFKRFPPRDIEMTVYGVTQPTYERVTRVPGSYAAFRRGLDLLLHNGVKVRLKAMACRSNVEELPEIADFCRQHTSDYFRFDPLMHLRLDRNEERNQEIRDERLSPAEIVALEQADGKRFQSMQEHCDHLIQQSGCTDACNHLFHCGAGNTTFSVGYDGTFRLCASLCAPGTIADLRQRSVAQAWGELVPQVRQLRSARPEFLQTCRSCGIVNLCMHCPAHAYLETGELDGDTPYFCAVAHARADMLRPNQASELPDRTAIVPLD